MSEFDPRPPGSSLRLEIAVGLLGTGLGSHRLGCIRTAHSPRLRSAHLGVR